MRRPDRIGGNTPPPTTTNTNTMRILSRPIGALFSLPRCAPPLAGHWIDAVTTPTGRGLRAELEALTQLRQAGAEQLTPRANQTETCARAASKTIAKELTIRDNSRLISTRGLSFGGSVGIWLCTEREQENPASGLQAAASCEKIWW